MPALSFRRICAVPSQSRRERRRGPDENLRRSLPPQKGRSKVLRDGGVERGEQWGGGMAGDSEKSATVRSPFPDHNRIHSLHPFPHFLSRAVRYVKLLG